MANFAQCSRGRCSGASSTAPPSTERSSSSRLRGLGYEVQVERNGTPEIKGYSREYLEANSLRSQQIREHLKAAGLDGAGPAQIAAHRTREAKVDLGQGRGQERSTGILPPSSATSPNRSFVRPTHAAFVRSTIPAKHAELAVTYARDKTFEREAVVDRRDLMKEALKRAYGNASFDQVTKAFDERVRSGEFVHSGSSTPRSHLRRDTRRLR